MKVSQTHLASAWASAALLAGCLLLSACGAKKGEVASYRLEGTFESTVNGKHHNGGSFTLRSCGSNTLVDMVFEGGYRESTGTDGRDSFTYGPVPPNIKAALTNASGIGSICSGRFPTNAQFAEQILWLACTHDPELVTGLRTRQFTFSGDYMLKEVPPRIQLSPASPHQVTSIQWYGPGWHAAGTNRYDLPMYPNGWLMAKVSVTTTQASDEVTVPAKVTYTHYAQRFITNVAQIRELHPRSPEDVLPVIIMDLCITNIQTEPSLPNYVPAIVDNLARVTDYRSGKAKMYMAGRGASWAECDMLAQHNWTTQLGRSDYGVVGRDAQTLPGGGGVSAYTCFYLGNHKVQFPFPFFWLLGGGLGLLFVSACVLVVAKRNK